MTKASVQEPAQQPSMARDRHEHPSDAGSAIPVLIRLPELEPSTATAQAGSPTDTVQPEVAATPDVARVAEKSDLKPGAAEAATEPAVTESAVAEPATTAHEPVKDGPWWSDFRVPSSVVHAVVALALVAVFIVAYMAIVGGGNEAEEIAADSPTAQEEQPAGKGKGDAQAGAPLAFKTFVPKDSQKPAAGGNAPAKQPAAAKPAAKQPAVKQPGAAAKQPAPKPQQPPAEKAAVPAEQQLAGGPKQPPANEPPAPKNASAIASEQQASSVQQTEFESPADSSAGQPATQPPVDRAQAGRPAGFRNETPAGQDLAANNPPLNRQPEPGTAGNQAADSPPAYPMTNPASYQYPADYQAADSPPPYPMTNPASYQYPADYHVRLLSPADAQSSPRNSTWSGGNSGDDQRPSTARLQPHIEAPPVR